MKALLDLLAGAGWSNSLEDLGTAVGIPRDGAEDLVKIATEGVLRTIVDKLLESKDFKVRDMAKRHEINLEIKTSFEGECSHNPPAVTSERAVALFVSGVQGESLTFAELQYHLKMMKLSTEEKDCERCGKAVVKTVKSSAKEYCDPDFLTIVLEQPASFNAPLKTGIKYGSSKYKVKTVVHWESSKSSASVSREKEDGWWWHGVVDSQGPDFRYNADQMHSCAHLKDAAVLMMVRMGEMSDCQESEQQRITNSNSRLDICGDDIEIQQSPTELKEKYAEADEEERGRGGEALMRVSEGRGFESEEQNIVTQQEGEKLALLVKLFCNLCYHISSI